MRNAFGKRLSQPLALFCFLFACSAAISGEAVPSGMKTAFVPATGEWNIAWPGRLAQYDVVYASPPVDPMQGIPLGNGDVGVLFWCEGSRLIAVVNKCDLWDDATFGRFHNWHRDEEEFSTTLRHACRVVFDFQVPIFDNFYLTDFSGRLSLADASCRINSRSVFGSVTIMAFVDHETGVLHCDLETDLKENLPVRISLERFGSRTYSHWYSQINRDATLGTEGTAALADSSGAYLEQTLSSGRFAVGAKVVNDGQASVTYERRHSRCSDITWTGTGPNTTQLAVAVTSPLTEAPIQAVKKILHKVQKQGVPTIRAAHAHTWKSLWLRSFMDFGDPYLNNLWHLTIYYAHGSQGGPYPGRFNNGLWTWSRDVQNWNFYFHWNQQQLYWPLNAAGYPELIDPYLNFRFNSLPQARADAREFFKVDGAFISDVSERRGYNSTGELINHTPIAEIALDFWRQYCYSGDKVYLREKALPFILEASNFFTCLFAKGDDGLYHATQGSGLEGWIRLKDGLTELAYGRALFSVALRALQESGTQAPQAAVWKEMLDQFAPLPVISAGDSIITIQNPVFRRGYNKGRSAPGADIFAAGWGIKENKWLTTFYPGDENSNHGFKLLDGIFPSVPSCPVFPSGWIGLAQKDLPLFKMAASTLLLYGPEVTGWDPVPIALARLGLASELARDLERFPQRWQIYVNGWGHWGLEGEINKDYEYFFRTNQVRDVSRGVKSEERFPLPMWPFRHMSMEAMSVLATAMNEALLQSHDGIIRIMPAVTAQQSARFTLHARGGFIVSAEKNNDELAFVAIKSLLGNSCRFEIPWPAADLYVSGKKIKSVTADKIQEIKTKAGQTLIMVPSGVRLSDWTVSAETPAANQKARRHSSGKAQLGLDRMF